MNDPVFIQWVRSDFTLNDDMFSRIKAHSNKLKNEVEIAVTMLTSIQYSTQSLSADRKQRLFANIEKTISESKKPKSKLRSILPWLAAACVLMLLFFKFGMNPKSVVESIAIATQHEHRSIELPDKSTVNLDAESRINYKTSFAGDRELYLEGRAHFDVKKGSSFRVNTQYGIITVLGTSFTVNCRENNFEVICREGKVQVALNDQADVIIITAMEATKMIGKTLELSSLKDNSPLKWMDGYFYFVDTTIGEVFDELSRQYNIQIECTEDTKNLMYSGFFKLNDIEGALKSVTWPMKLKVEKISESRYSVTR